MTSQPVALVCVFADEITHTTWAGEGEPVVLTVDFREPLADPSYADAWYSQQLDMFDCSGVGRDHDAWAELQYQAGRVYDLAIGRT